MSKFEPFFTILQCVKTIHWEAQAYTVHKITGDFYDSLESHIDKYVEVTILETPKYNPIALKNKENPVKLVKEIKSYFSKIKGHRNIIDEVLDLCDQTVYLLKMK